LLARDASSPPPACQPLPWLATSPFLVLPSPLTSQAPTWLARIVTPWLIFPHMDIHSSSSVPGQSQGQSNHALRASPTSIKLFPSLQGHTMPLGCSSINVCLPNPLSATLCHSPPLSATPRLLPSNLPCSDWGTTLVLPLAWSGYPLFPLVSLTVQCDPCRLPLSRSTLHSRGSQRLAETHGGDTMRDGDRERQRDREMERRREEGAQAPALSTEH